MSDLFPYLKFNFFNSTSKIFGFKKNTHNNTKQKIGTT